jgi:N-acetylneuraminic acid mutarotase
VTRIQRGLGAKQGWNVEAILLELEALENRFLLAWATISSFTSLGREGLAAVSGSDGRIYAIGGESETGTTFTQTGEVDAYTISSNTWSIATPLPDEALELSAAEGGDGRIYAMGGLNSSGTVIANVYAYSPTTNAWVQVAPLLTARFDTAAAAGSDGRIYVFGGSTSTTTLGSNILEIYDPTTNTWSTGAPMPTARWGAAAATGSNGDIYVFGGADPSSNALTTVEAYNPTNNSWTTKNSIPTAVYYAGAALGPSGSIYVVGGTETGTDNEQITQIYNPSNNTWSAGPLLITGRSNLGVTTGTNGQIYAIGGTGSVGGATPAPLNTAETLNVTGTSPTPPAGTTPVYTTGPYARYVDALYADLLGRAPDSTALGDDTTALDEGTASVQSVAQGILNSTEYRTDTVEALYEEVLGRAVDPSGLQSSLYLLDHGEGALTLEVVLLGSQEFYAGPGQGTNTGFINATYSIVLHRAPDAAGENVFLQDLANGETTRQVAQQIVFSTEGESVQIQSEYQALLHRSVDAAGLAANLRLLQAGGGIEGVIFNIVTSTEYINDANANANVLFVDQAYQDLLGRQPDAGGLATYTGYLNSGALSRQQTALGIETSSEFYGDELTDLYALVLHRAPDPGGEASGLALLSAGVSSTTVEAILLGSQEFYVNFGGSTNAGWANALYEVALGRAIDPAGAQSVNQALAEGLSRSIIALNVLHSAEADTDLVNSLYAKLLGRAPDSGGLATYVGLLESGYTVEQVQAILIGSPEFLSEL